MMICQLSEMVTSSPSEIYEAVPGASTKQIGGFFKLVKALDSTGPVKRLQRDRDAKQPSAGDAVLEQLRQLSNQRQDRMWNHF